MRLRPHIPSPAFTLIEVMIALAIFFVAMFGILGVMSRGLAAARGLQLSGPDPGLVAAELSLTNKLEDGGSDNGEFGKMYPRYSWAWESYEVGSNGLFKVDIHVFHDTVRGRQEESTMSILMYPREAARSSGLRR